MICFYFGKDVHVLCLLCRIFKEKLKIQERPLFKVHLSYTSIRIMIVYENVLKSDINKAKQWLND